MRRRYVGLAIALLMVMGAALSLPSCGHDQKLVSLQVQPSTFTFLTPDPLATEQYTATATYIHPPETRDVTGQATWAVDDGVVSFGAPGLVSPVVGACGGGTISAKMPEGTGGSQNIVLAYATVTVDDPTNPLCPGGGTVATLSVGINGTGTVSSTPAGITCPGTCIATYDVGASVVLNASGGQFQSWSNCSGSGNSCTVTIPSGGVAVVANFE
jgi:hypothetical protein